MHRSALSPLLSACLAAGLLCGCGRPGGGEDGPKDEFARAARTLEPLHRRKGEPQSGEWLDRFDEPGQTFAEYVDSDPVRPDADRNAFYIALLGAFEPEAERIVTLTAKFMEIYFGVPVRFAPPIDASAVPPEARRRNPFSDQLQFHAGFILDEILEPRLPDDAVALIAFTATDLYPRDSWNFVFGMASLRERVGVWSLWRFADPAESDESFAQCLLLTVKVGSHETGHMIGMRHCVLWECNMNGSNSLAESVRQPLALCPECVAKIWWACGTDPVGRYRALEAFCAEHGLESQAAFYRKSREAIAPVFDQEPGAEKKG